MSWNRHNGLLENLMAEALLKSDELSIQDVVNAIVRDNPDAFTGTTPRNSLYSIVYRLEKKRLANKGSTRFNRIKKNGVYFYSLNNKFKGL